MTNSDFPRTLSLLRKEKGLSQREVSDALGISQALLSHYEKGVREPGLGFVASVCDYYHVSADYLLGRTLAKDGAIISSEEVVDASEDGDHTLKGSIIATLQKKLIVNAVSVLFDLLGKLGNRNAINGAADYLSGILYNLYRHLYRAAGQNDQFFALPEEDFLDNSTDMMGKKAKRTYLRALATSVKKEEPFPPMSQEDISDKYPGLSQSVTQILHNIDTKTLEMLEK